MVRWLFIIKVAILLSISASNAMELQAFQCIYHFAKIEYLKRAHGAGIAFLYERIFFDRAFHPNAQVRSAAFRTLAPCHVSPEVLEDLRQRAPEAIEVLINQLANVPEAVRPELVGALSKWRGWSESVLQGSEKLAAKYSDYQGVQVETDFLLKVIQQRDNLEAEGIVTEFVPGVTIAGFENGIRKGRGLLVIRRIDRSRRPALKQKLLPGMRVIDSQYFDEFLAAAEKDRGSIVIDPDLGSSWKTKAYFLKTSDAVPGKDWIIGIQPESSGSHFAHEWQHKTDEIDRLGIFPEAHSWRYSNQRSSVIGRALYDFGSHLEKKHIKELNATARQFQLYFETGSFPPGDVLHTIIYRGRNQKKVAIGRILMDPENPLHYVLWVRGALKTYGPIAIASSPFWIPKIIEYLNTRDEKTPLEEDLNFRELIRDAHSNNMPSPVSGAVSNN